jgi:hypothetical protein
MKPINTLCGQNTTLLNAKAGGTRVLRVKYQPVKKLVKNTTEVSVIKRRLATLNLICKAERSPPRFKSSLHEICVIILPLCRFLELSQLMDAQTHLLILPYVCAHYLMYQLEKPSSHSLHAIYTLLHLTAYHAINIKDI